MNTSIMLAYQFGEIWKEEHVQVSLSLRVEGLFKKLQGRIITE